MVSIPEYVGFHRRSSPRRRDAPVLGVEAETRFKITVGDGRIEGGLCGSNARDQHVGALGEMIPPVFCWPAGINDEDRSPQLTCVFVAKLWRKGNVVQSNMSASRAVKAHFKNHLEVRETNTNLLSHKSEKYGKFPVCIFVYSLQPEQKETWIYCKNEESEIQAERRVWLRKISVLSGSCGRAG